MGTYCNCARRAMTATDLAGRPFYIGDDGVARVLVPVEPPEYINVHDTYGFGERWRKIKVVRVDGVQEWRPPE